MADFELLIPIVLFASTATVLSLWLYYRFRTRRDFQETVRSAIEKGQELTPELLQQLGHPIRTGNADMRRGIVLIAVGIGLALFGFVVDEHDAIRPMLAIGTLPVIVGIAYLALWQFGGKRA